MRPARFVQFPPASPVAAYRLRNANVAAAYLFWTYYPHGLPLPTKEAVHTPPAPPPPAAGGKPDIGDYNLSPGVLAPLIGTDIYNGLPAHRLGRNTQHVQSAC